MADIFLSYNEKDRDTVRRLAETLKSVGWSVWWDRHIPAGGTWRQLLERELAAMRCMIVVWSSNSVKSEWVCEEATEGRLQGCLMPVCIEAVKPPAGFREIQAADLVGWDGTATFIGMRTLIEDIQQRIGAPVDEAKPNVEEIAQVVVPSSVKAREEPAAPLPALPRRDPLPPAQTRPSVAMIAGVVAIMLVAIALYGAYGRSDRQRSDASKAAAAGETAAMVPTTPVRTDEVANAAPAQAAAAPAFTGPSNPATDRPHVQDTDGIASLHFKSPANPSMNKIKCDNMQSRLRFGETLTNEQKAFIKDQCAQ